VRRPPIVCCQPRIQGDDGDASLTAVTQLALETARQFKGGRSVVKGQLDSPLVAR
jgi:hypothetical protein